MALLTVREAQERIRAAIQTIKETEQVPLQRVAGRILAQPIAAPFDYPLFDNSSMDGFAVRADDVSSATRASARTLQVVADLAAGSTLTSALGAGEAARIMTGAPLPLGADSVVPVEETDFQNNVPGSSAPAQVNIYHAIKRGDFVRPRGQDLHRGQEVLQGGQRLRAQDLALLAMLGVAQVNVIRQPRVALISTGNELVPVESQLGEGQIHESNSVALTAQLEADGAVVVRLGIARDERAAVRSALERALDESSDMILSSAGVSVGAYDFVKEVVEAQGSLDFWKVNMRPGKPLAFGSFRGIHFMGLPGNPVSAFVTYEVFARAALQKLSGELFSERPSLRVKLSEPIESDGRESYLRGIVDFKTGSAQLAGHQGSGNLFSLVQANALLIIPAGVKSAPAGQEVEAWLLHN